MDYRTPGINPYADYRTPGINPYADRLDVVINESSLDQLENQRTQTMIFVGAAIALAFFLIKR